MKKLLVVIDMQKDFITNALGTPEARAIVGDVAEYIKNFDGDIVFTRDTHYYDYLDTQEGKRLPVPHCIFDTDGWEFVPAISNALNNTSAYTFEKNTFGSVLLGKAIYEQDYDEVTLVGVCTDICVVSNALLIKAFSPEVTINVIERLCAGTTPEAHNAAIATMKSCQINII